MPNTQTCAPVLVAPSRYSEVNYSAFNYNFTDCVLFTRASVAEIFNAKLISLKEKNSIKTIIKAFNVPETVMWTWLYLSWTHENAQRALC